MARDIKQLHPLLQQIIPVFLDACAAEGLKAGIADCLRSKAEQNALFQKGRYGNPGPIVTKMQYPYSFHCWGLAFDIYRNDGSGVYNTADRWFERAGTIGIRLGLTWGGNFKSFKDRPHFQLNNYGSSCKALVNRFGTPERFFQTWKNPALSSQQTASAVLTAASQITASIPRTVTASSPKEDIRWLQRKLNEKAKAGLSVDGVFGKRTRSVLLQFQIVSGLRNDIFADPDTIEKLKQ